MLLHGYVPNNFSLGVVVPILKDKYGDLSSVDNYRPVTLSPTIAKIFESVLLIKYGDYLYSDDRQFGFKKNMGCRNAIFAVRNIINHFNWLKVVVRKHIDNFFPACSTTAPDSLAASSTYDSASVDATITLLLLVFLKITHF